MKPHYRLRCRLSPFVPRLGWSFVMWRVDLLLEDGRYTDYGAWFQNSAKAIAAVSLRQERAVKFFAHHGFEP